MATNNQVNVGLSGNNGGSNGTGTFVGNTTPTLVTPTLGVASLTSINFGSSTAGTIGTTTNNNATALSVGEFVSASVLVGAPVAVTNGIVANITNISLTAGDWDVSGTCWFVPAGGAATVVITGVSNTSAATQSPFGENNFAQSLCPVASGATVSLSVNGARYSLAGTTTIYLIVEGFFAGTMNTYGFISARRVR